MKPIARISLFALALSLLLAVPASAQEKKTKAPAAPIDPKYQIPATDDGLPGAGPIRRYDWFQRLWAQRRAQWAKDATKDKGAFVFLGDSITQGWNTNLATSFPGVKTANRGISGDTTRGVLIRLKEDVLDLNPSGIVLLIGTNDLEEGADPETIAANLKLILAALKQHNPKMPILLNMVFPSSVTKKRPADAIKKINTLYLAAIKDDAQVMPVETWQLFANAQGDAKPDEFPDLLHPNKTGYAKWAAALRPFFATLGLMDTAADTFQPEPGFVSLFNGRDLTGWGYRKSSENDVANSKKKNAPSWPVFTEDIHFDGKTVSSDGRYFVKNGRLVVGNPAEYRRIQQIWTTKDFPKNFVLKLEFRAGAYADSGIFIRKPQLQCRDFLTAGPYKTLTQYKPQEWNEVVVTVKDGVAHCTCNGEVLEAALKVPETGPIGLEGDRGQMEYRRIRMQELP